MNNKLSGCPSLIFHLQPSLVNVCMASGPLITLTIHLLITCYK